MRNQDGSPQLQWHCPPCAPSHRRRLDKRWGLKSRPDRREQACACPGLSLIEGVKNLSVCEIGQIISVAIPQGAGTFRSVLCGVKAEDYFGFNMLAGVEVLLKIRSLWASNPRAAQRGSTTCLGFHAGSSWFVVIPGAANQSRSLLRYPSASPKTYQSFSSHLDMRLWMLVSPRLRPSSGQAASSVSLSAYSTRLKIRWHANASFETATNGTTPSSGCGRSGGYTFLLHSG